MIETIPGWFFPADVKLFSWFLSVQTESGMKGDLAELGVYLGRSAVLMGSHLQPGETFTVIDLFSGEAAGFGNQLENDQSYTGLTRTVFEDNYRRVLRSLPTVITGPSAEITRHAAHGRHRFVHVDASHLYAHVREDIRSAHTLLLPDGIVVCDDILVAHTPGVQAAVWEAAATAGLRPIVISENKLYATWGDYVKWQMRLKESMPLGLECETQEVLGRPLLRVWGSPPDRRQKLVEALIPPAILRRAGRLRRGLQSRCGAGHVSKADVPKEGLQPHQGPPLSRDGGASMSEPIPIRQGPHRLRAKPVLVIRRGR